MEFKNKKKGKNTKIDKKPFAKKNNLITKIEPIDKIIKKIKNKYKIIYLSPQGKKFNQKSVKNLSKNKELIIICGKNTGIDENTQHINIEKISLGDYIISNGDIGSIIITDAILRENNELIKKENIINETFNKDSFEEKNFISKININNKKKLQINNKENLIKCISKIKKIFYRPDLNKGKI